MGRWPTRQPAHAEHPPLLGTPPGGALEVGGVARDTPQARSIRSSRMPPPSLDSAGGCPTRVSVTFPPPCGPRGCRPGCTGPGLGLRVLLAWTGLLTPLRVGAKVPKRRHCPVLL